MDTLKKIETLFQQAAAEPTPVFGVAPKVLFRLAQVSESLSFLTFDMVAAVSAVAASIILFWAINTWIQLSDPMIAWLTPIQEVPLW
jgi:hypothetical protein